MTEYESEKSISISIIIPCYNHGQYIDEAINSVESITDISYEIIIINDGSTDELTNQKLKQLKCEGYNIIFQKNMGLGASRNNAIKLARGKYILPLDADNKIKPEYVTKALEILDNNQSVSIVYSDRQTFGLNEEVIKAGIFDISIMLTGNYIDACAIFRKSVWQKVRGYEENLPVQGWEDWDFWISASKESFKFHYIPEPLFFYRVVENSMITKLMSHSEMKSCLEYIYRKHIFYFYEVHKKYVYDNLYIAEYERTHALNTSKIYFAKWIRNNINLLKDNLKKIIK